MDGLRSMDARLRFIAGLAPCHMLRPYHYVVTTLCKLACVVASWGQKKSVLRTRQSQGLPCCKGSLFAHLLGLAREYVDD
jgi:hypothetical protein